MGETPEERIARLEERDHASDKAINGLTSAVSALSEMFATMDKRLASMKGYLAGIVLATSAVWAIVVCAIEYIALTGHTG